jgi:4-amino-4-deoxy-L-arabinose transferase-like glycosyltransferase
VLLSLALVVLLGAALRFYDLGGESLWMDEAFTWLWAHQDHGALWGAAGRWETNPPLYYSIQKVWRGLFGDSEAALRSFSAVAGTLAVPIVFLIGRLIGGAGAGLIAALLLAVLPIHVQYSQEARSYALLILAATTAVWGLLVFLRSHGGLASAPASPEGRGRLLGLAAYAVGTTVALYAHNTAALLPLFANAIALCWWIGRVRFDRRFALAWLIANLVPFILWLWWLPTVAAQAPAAANLGWIEQPRFLSALLQAASLYGTIGWFWIGPVPLLGILALWHWRDRWPAVAVLLVFVLGVPAATWLFGLIVRPIWVTRVILWPLGFGVVLAAGGALAIRPRWARAAVVGLVVAIQLLHVLDDYRSPGKPPWQRVVADLAAASGPEDVIVFFPHVLNWPFAYYAEPLAIAAAQVGLYDGEPPPFNVVEQTGGQAMRYLDWREVPALAASYERAWVIFRNRAKVDPDGLLLERLAEAGTVRLYRSYPPDPPKVEVFLLSFEQAEPEDAGPPAGPHGP